MPTGMILLLVIAALIFFGFLHRVLDRMHMNDTIALAFIGAMIIGTFLPNITLPMGLAINLGGGVVPIIVAVYLIATADSSAEKIRAVAAAVITGGIIYAAGRLLPAEPETMIIDPMIAFSLLAGIIAYIFGRSRRAAFIAGILGVVISDIIYALGITAMPAPGTVIGGAGVFDGTVIAGVLAVGLCELGGETLERLQGGSYAKKRQSAHKEMTSMLTDDVSSKEEGEDDNDGKE